ncbi:hypothetical protein M422DRAFT_29255 [Sphaerobolus stellatus SS14]|nr:hypothetical protein M422DRAFT_29255 [Sphaerobolus stellatus SS14]
MLKPFGIRSTYRGLLRQARYLPHLYLRTFFRVKITHYFRNNIVARWDLPERLLAAKLKRAEKELRLLRRANNGEKRAFDYVLDVAYGRRGKLKHELSKHYLTNPYEPPPPRIIPQVERSRPPSYSPELVTLLTSGHARTQTKPLKPSALVTPPTLPERANPSSEEARLLGRLSLRREVNIRWRYHSGELKKTYFPLEVSEASFAISDDQIKSPRPTGVEELALVSELERLARSPHEGVPMPRRQRLSESSAGQKQNQNQSSRQASIKTDFNSPKPIRFIRRRYRELLSRVPILRQDSKSKTGCSTAISSLAISHGFKGMTVPNAAEEDVEWVLRASADNKT